MRPAIRIAVWAGLAAAIAVPVAVAASSPYLAWRGPIYIAAGFAGIVAMTLLLVQPLLGGGYLPGLTLRQSRGTHRWIGAALVGLVVVHVAGLWLTSPPDVVDALLFRSPTPFSAWGVVAMLAVLAAGLLAAFRRRLALSPGTWRRAHMALVAIIVPGSIVHALLIEGAMGTVSKAVLCVLVGAAAIRVLVDTRGGVAPVRRRP